MAAQLAADRHAAATRGMPERPAHRLRDERGSTVPVPAPSHRGCTPRYGRGRSARLLRSTAARLPESALQMNPNYLDRSEEHPSELQSLMRLSYAVFCLKQKNPLTHY